MQPLGVEFLFWGGEAFCLTWHHLFSSVWALFWLSVFFFFFFLLFLFFLFSRVSFGVFRLSLFFFPFVYPPNWRPVPVISAAMASSVPLPTIDRPFGIHLWPLFSKAFEYVAGYPAEEFDFVVGKTPMSTLRDTSIFVAIYYLVIFGGRELMRNRDPFKLKTLFLIHNFVLTAVSAALLALFIEQLLPTVARRGILYAVCDANGGWTQPLIVLYYVGFFPCPAALRNGFGCG